jgi:hypothetical protein
MLADVQLGVGGGIPVETVLTSGGIIISGRDVVEKVQALAKGAQA